MNRIAAAIVFVGLLIAGTLFVLDDDPFYPWDAWRAEFSSGSTTTSCSGWRQGRRRPARGRSLLKKRL
jgi:hypothetical protein